MQMAIAVVFTPVSMTTAQYDEIITRLEQAGAGTPAGRLYHISSGSADQVQVMDVWESSEAFEQFGQTLMPILQQLGVDPGQPAISPVHSIIKGE
jgi:hypothetical protein